MVDHFRKTLACLLAFTTAVMPLHTTAQVDEIGLIGREGQAFGRELAADFIANPAIVKDGKIFTDQGVEFHVSELYPGAAEGAELSEFFSDGLTPDIEALQDIYDSDNSMVERGEETQGSLWDDAYSTSPSISGAAYKVIIDSANLSRPDFNSDPMMGQTFDIYDNIDLIAEGFGDCSAEDVFTDISLDVHNPQYETCERVTDKSDVCEVIHDYEAAVVKHHDGPYNVAPCDGIEGCTDLWIGRVGDNYWSGNCSIYEEYTEVTVHSPEAITSATLVRAKWDDYMQIWIGEPGREEKVWQGPDNNFPPETSGACELNTSWDQSPNLDLTRHFKNVAEGAVIRFKIRVSVTGEGEGFGTIRLRYDPSKAVIRDEWRPDSCIESSLGVKDGFAKGDVKCIDDPRDAQGCTYTNGIKICEGSLKPSPIPGIPNLCRKVDVDADYDFYKGEMDCYINIQGEEVCPVNDGGNLNTCKAYEENPKCGYISSSCVDGAAGASGTCYVQEEIWDCGSSVPIDTVEKSTEYQCSGPIRCMGADCLDPTQTSNQSANFAKASALLNAAQFMTQDMVCSGMDEEGNPLGEENVMCSAFGGVAGECKIAVGGVQDCCEKPSNVGMADYLRMIRLVPKMDGAVLSLESGPADMVASAYKTIRNPAVNSFSEITQPFTSYMDNVSGAVADFFSPLSELKDQLVGQLKEQARQLFQDTIGNLAQDAATEAAVAAGADGATNSARDSMASNSMSMLGGAMMIYTYYQVAIAVIQMVWACEQEELEMNSKRGVDSCTYVGSYCATEVLGQCIEKREAYCCFNSPLSRIIQEQVRPQLGWDFGNPESPSCNGIPLDRISEIDWDQVNLDEWLAILAQNGMFPTADGIGMDALTGSGSAYDLDGNRLPADERALQRLDGVDIDAKRREVMEGIEVRPRGLNR